MIRRQPLHDERSTERVRPLASIATAALSCCLTFGAGLAGAAPPGAADAYEPRVMFPSAAPDSASGETATAGVTWASGMAADEPVSPADSAAATMALSASGLPIVAGRTPATFGVGTSGASSYVIPIWTPPGVGDVALALSLNYSSRSGDGVLGQGWSLTGLSAITRCNKTWAQDGAPAPVAYAASDRFCLDGQQLKLVSGVYGQAGSTYATEIESYSNVVAVGTTGVGPTSFTVTTKNGLVYEYGTTADSQVYAGTRGTIRTWALSRVRDRANITDGNSIAIAYTNDARNGAYTNGSYRVSSITYPRTATGQGPFYSVTFNYSARPANDALVSYDGGDVIREPNKLDSINVSDYGSGAIIKSYSFAYGQGPATSRLLLQSVQECSSLNCLEPTTISYQAGGKGWSAVTTTALGASPKAKTFRVDMNGDGLDDLLFPVGLGNNKMSWRVAFASATGYAAAVDTGVSADASYVPLPGRFLGNGRWQFLLSISGKWTLVAYEGTAFQRVATSVAASDTLAIDLDGDGLYDLASFNSVAISGGAASCTVYARRNVTSPGAGATGFAVSVTRQLWRETYTCGELGEISSIDVNSDNRSDLLVTMTDTRPNPLGGIIILRSFQRILVSNGTDITATPGLLIPEDSYLGLAGDVNGDGCTDFIRTSRISVSDCAGGFQITNVSTPGVVSGSGQGSMVADWDGDGRSDLLYVSSQSGSNPYKWYVMRSTGDGYQAPVDTGISAYQSTTWFTLDANGDGKTDLGWRDDSNGGKLKYHLHSAPGVAEDLATTFIDGFGMSQSPSYVSISSSNYTKESGAVFPEIDFKGPLYVVSRAVLSDGTGGTYRNDFEYFGARVHLQGRGFEGFRVRRARDSRDGTYTYDYLKQQFPYTGQVAQQTVLQDAAIPASKLRERVAQFGQQTLGPAGVQQRVFPYVSSSTETRYELGASQQNLLVSQVTTVYTYGDGYGNVTLLQRDETDMDAASPFVGSTWRTTVSTSYVNDAANNCFGLASTVSATESAPGQAARTRSAAYAVDAQRCRVWQQVLEPATPELKVATTLAFDGCGNASSLQIVGAKPDGAPMQARTTLFDYGTRCQLPEVVTNALGQSTRYAYRYDFGVLASATDPNLLETSWTHDDFGRRTLEKRPDKTTTAWSYESCRQGPCWGAGDLRFHVYETAKGSDGSIYDQREQLFDGFDRLRSRQHMRALGAWVSENWLYDSLGRTTRLDRPTSAGSNGYVTQTYDVLNRVTAQSLYQSNGTLDRTTVIGYAGRTVSTTDPLGHLRKQVFDVAGRLRRVIDPLPGGTTRYEYDSLGNLNRIEDSIGAVSTGVYNLRGFRTQWADADRGTWNYSGNSLNELVAWTDARNQSFSMTYDPLGRRTSRTEPEGLSTWTWGASAASHDIGQLVSKSGYGYTEVLGYDTVGRLATRCITTDQNNYDFDFAYNPSGALDTLTYPVSPVPTGGTATRFKVKYGYSYGRTVSVTDVTDTPVTLWTMTAANDYESPTVEALANGATVSSTFKPWTNELTSRQAGLAPSLNNRQNLAYQWDTAGNLTQRQDLNQALTEAFTMDALDRVKSSTLNGQPNFSADYDASGNLTSRSDVGSLSYGNAAHPHAVMSAGSHTYTYDANGNQITRDGASQAWASYNLPLQLSQPIGGTTYLSQFSYGPDHQRWKQVASYSNGTETTWYVGGLLEKESPAPSGNTQWRHYVPLPSGMSIIVVRASNSPKAVRYVLTDHLGSADRMLDEAGAVAVGLSYGAFGNRRGSNWGSGAPDWPGIAGTTRRGYTGHEHLDNLQLIHMNGRVYDPGTGRFLSVDPLLGDLGDSQQVNPYAYVGNRPLSAIDPSGFQSVAAGLGSVDPNDPGPGSGAGGQVLSGRLERFMALYGGYEYLLAVNQAAMQRVRTTAQDGAALCGPGQPSMACNGPALGTSSTPASPGAGYLPQSQSCIGTSKQCGTESFWRDNAVGRFSSSLLDPLALFNGGVNPLSGIWLTPREQNDARFTAFVTVASLGMSSLGVGGARGVAGSIRGVNPLRSATNCVNCAIATDATLSGGAASALPSGPTSISVLEKMFGGRFASVSGPGAIESQLLSAGSGSRGIVFGSRGAGQVGHVFNAINQNGVVRFLDGQIGSAASLEGYTSFSFLRTF